MGNDSLKSDMPCQYEKPQASNYGWAWYRLTWKPYGSKAAHPHYLLLLLQKMLAEKQLRSFFLTSSFVSMFFEVLISSLHLFNLHVELLPAKKQDVSTHVLISIYQLPSLQVQTYQSSGDWTWSNLVGCIQHKLHQYWRTQSSPEYSQHVICCFSTE